MGWRWNGFVRHGRRATRRTQTGPQWAPGPKSPRAPPAPLKTPPARPAAVRMEFRHAVVLPPLEWHGDGLEFEWGKWQVIGKKWVTGDNSLNLLVTSQDSSSSIACLSGCIR